MKTVEQKLELIQLMRMEQEENLGRMQRREQILTKTGNETKKKSAHTSYKYGFIIRTLISIFIFMYKIFDFMV